MSSLPTRITRVLHPVFPAFYSSRRHLTAPVQALLTLPTCESKAFASLPVSYVERIEDLLLTSASRLLNKVRHLLTFFLIQYFG